MRTVTVWLLGAGEGAACGYAPLTSQWCLLAEQLPRRIFKSCPKPLCVLRAEGVRWGCKHWDASGEEAAKGMGATIAGWGELGARRELLQKMPVVRHGEVGAFCGLLPTMSKVALGCMDKEQLWRWDCHESTSGSWSRAQQMGMWCDKGLKMICTSEWGIKLTVYWNTAQGFLFTLIEMSLFLNGADTFEGVSTTT